ncbi:phytoene desaturase family protein [Larsenimonas salina]|uniref:phytoene desaturase family protein n=1 Tax=Larsenimonas salina TaxID=1295565 RepID=UPI002072C098|nr:phytoene desaturase family protein [Larsenimonas salina]MCM5703090.1 phytoene desaturase family protein [Larsenimonas salina]
MTHTLVIGGGFGGMAAALRARKLGHDVTLLERGNALGGRAQVFEDKGYRFDAGPTVITAAFMFEELFELFGKRLSDYVEMIDLDTWYEFYFQDGRRFRYGADLDDTLEQIAHFNPRDVDGYTRLLEHSKAIFDVGFTELADKPFHRFSTMVRQIPALVRLKSHRSVWGMVSHYLEDPSLRKAFSIPPLLVGGNPFKTTSIYALIPYLERKWGVQFPRGGTGALVGALEQLMREEGIHIETGVSVGRLQAQGRRVTGVVLEDGSTRPADRVIANADAAYLYKHMTPNLPALPKLKLKAAKYSMGLFVLYLGVDARYSDVAHHTIWFGEQYKTLLADIFDHHVLNEDVSLYVHRPTATDESFAPPGCDSFYILAPVPNLQGDIDWAEEGPRLAERIIASLSKTLLPGLEHHIATQFHMTPADFGTRYLSEHGSGFSIAPLFRQSAWFRFHNKSEALDRLYLVGAGTHPGAGLPGVVSSAKVVERLMVEESPDG